MYNKIAIFPLCVFISCFVCIDAVQACDAEHVVDNAVGGGISFIENKGQWVSEAKFKAELPGGSVFITDGGFVYTFQSEEDWKLLHEAASGKPEAATCESELARGIRSHSYRVNFIGSKHPTGYSTAGRRSYYHNYFIGKDSSKWAGNVSLFEKVIQQDIYAGIDLAVYSNGTMLKYDFIVAPGANPSSIVLEFEGVEPVLTPEGHLRIVTSVNEIIEEAPYVYQLVSGKEVVIPCYYRLSRGRLSFVFPEAYDRSQPLIIDPNLVFSTYSGSILGKQIAYATTYDKSGNLYAGAYSPSTGGWPTTFGAFQTVQAGMIDVGINKYNASGTQLIYSTYYGGSDMDFPRAMVVNDAGELIVSGTTASVDLPVSVGCYDNTYNGDNDIFVARFDSTGSNLLAGTYIGTSGNETGFESYILSGLNVEYGEAIGNDISRLEITLDHFGNIWVASNTDALDFPVTSNAFQSTHGGGGTDGIVFQLDPACSQLLYSTYIGGSAPDVCLNILVNQAGNVVVCGGTMSADFPTTAGVLHATKPGGVDGFVSIIESQTGLLLQSTFLGSTQTDYAARLQVDEHDNVLVLGQTLGNYPVSSGVYHIPNSDLFIDKLSPTLTQSLSSTRLGNSQILPPDGSRLTPVAFLYDKVCGNVYLSAIGAESSLPVTSDAYESLHCRFWFAVLRPEFSELQYATYFGSPLAPNLPLSGDHAHSGIHRFAPDGTLYMTICSGSSNFPITPNAAFPVKTNTSLDNLSFKFDFERIISIAGVELPEGLNDTVCGAPYTFQFHNSSTGATRYEWDFGDGTTLSTDIHPAHTYFDTGRFKVRLIAYNDTSCMIADTAFYTVTILGVVPPDITVSDTTLYCQMFQPVSLSVTVNNPSPNNRFEWGPQNGINGSNTNQSVSVSPHLNDVYYVTVTDSIPGLCGLSVTDTIHIIMPYLELFTSGEVVVSPACEYTANGSASFTSQFPDTTVYILEWRSNSDTTVLSQTQSLSGVKSGLYNVKVSITEHCDTSYYIHFYIPEESYSVSFEPDTVVCTGDLIPFRNTSQLHFTEWHWDFGDGDTSQHAAPAHSYTDSGTYTVTLVGRGQLCTDTFYRSVVVDAPVSGLAFDKDKDSICVGQSINFYPKTGFSFTGLQWNFGDGGGWSYTPNQSEVKHAFDHAGEMPIILIAQFRACPSIMYMDSVKVHPFPLVDLGSDSVICLHQAPLTLKNLAKSDSGYYRYRWNAGGDTSHTFNVVHHGTYTLSVTNIHGCTTTEEITVDKDCYVDIPNVFTPNNDGVNDYFFPRQLLSKSITRFRFQIFNRWGQKLFETTATDGRGWDGKLNGKEQPAGVYVYQMNVTFDGGREEAYSGNVTMLR